MHYFLMFIYQEGLRKRIAIQWRSIHTTKLDRRYLEHQAVSQLYRYQSKAALPVTQDNLHDYLADIEVVVITVNYAGEN